MVRLLTVVVLLLSASLPAYAQQPADALRGCLADNTSGKDRKDLAKWIFLAIAAHPEMKNHATGDLPTAMDDASKTMGALVTRLLGESCAKETGAVLTSAQSSQAMQLAFQGLGTLAMQELMADPAVLASMGLFERYLDPTRLKTVLGGK
jgi:hypothetical protein